MRENAKFRTKQQRLGGDASPSEQCPTEYLQRVSEQVRDNKEEARRQRDGERVFFVRKQKQQFFVLEPEFSADEFEFDEQQFLIESFLHAVQRISEEIRRQKIRPCQTARTEKYRQNRNLRGSEFERTETPKFPQEQQPIPPGNSNKWQRIPEKPSKSIHSNRPQRN